MDQVHAEKQQQLDIFGDGFFPSGLTKCLDFTRPFRKLEVSGKVENICSGKNGQGFSQDGCGMGNIEIPPRSP